MSHTPPRPQWNDPAVKQSAVDCVHEPVRDWCAGNGSFDPETDSPVEFRALLTLALTECPDAYGAARYLDDFAGWPADGELTRILDHAYRRMPYLVEPVVSAWVMKHSIRFAAKKEDVIRFRVGDAELTGTVLDVNRRLALGYVDVIRNKGQVLTVPAETITENLGPSKKKPQPGGNGGGRYA